MRMRRQRASQVCAGREVYAWVRMSMHLLRGKKKDIVVANLPSRLPLARERGISSSELLMTATLTRVVLVLRDTDAADADADADADAFVRYEATGRSWVVAMRLEKGAKGDPKPIEGGRGVLEFRRCDVGERAKGERDFAKVAAEKSHG